jgi:hypothetical protein
MIAGMAPPNSLRLVFWITLSAVVVGALVTHAHYRPDLTDATHAYLQGGVVGGLTGASLATLELFVLR